MSHHPATSGVNRQCSSGDLMILVYHVILPNHVTKGSCEFMGRNPSISVITLPSFV